MNGARNFALKTYKSKVWKKRSLEYRMNHPYCERCLRKGIVTPSALVHHKNEISLMNYEDMNVWLSEDNLEALCRKCHGLEHSEGAVDFNLDGSLYLGDDEE